MRRAYAIHGLIVLVVLAGAGWAVSHSSNFPARTDTIAPASRSASTTMLTLTSPAFENGSQIPREYTCDGEGTSVPLSISGVPEEAQSLALIAIDPDVPKQIKPDGSFTHWVLFNIPADTAMISEGAGTSGTNGAGTLGYIPPCPPPQYEPSEHRYVFTVSALDRKLDLPQGASLTQVRQAIAGHAIAEAEIIGKYRRSR